MSGSVYYPHSGDSDPTEQGKVIRAEGGRREGGRTDRNGSSSGGNG